MTNLNNYDNAFSRYYNALENRTMPLNSWDFFTSHFYALKSKVSDASELQQLAAKKNWVQQWNFKKQLERKVIVVTDAKLSIVFASQNMVQMSGYSPEEIIGKTPKMFQGEKTSKTTLQEIRMAISEGKPFDKVIVNYKKNGETYKCHIKGFPVFDKNNKLSNFIAFERAA